MMERSATGKTRTGAFRPEKVVAALETEPLPWVYLFQKRAGVSTTHPGYDLEFSTQRFLEGDPVYVLRAAVPGQEGASLAGRWWRIAAESGLLAGSGYAQSTPVDHLGYGTFYAGSPLGEKPRILQDWIDSERRMRYERESFMPVVEGRILRNVLRHSLMTAVLAGRIRAALDRAGVSIGAFEALPGERVLWTIEDPGAQQDAYAVRSDEGLVWEHVWFDLGRQMGPSIGSMA